MVNRNSEKTLYQFVQQMYADGMLPAQIANQLNSEGIRGPLGGNITHRTISQILKQSPNETSCAHRADNPLVHTDLEAQ